MTFLPPSAVLPAAPETFVKCERSFRSHTKPADTGTGMLRRKIISLTHGKSADDPDIMGFGNERAAAMAYRDARGEGITEQDWLSIEMQLRSAYQRLKVGIDR
jgi:hypothetical protein